MKTQRASMISVTLMALLVTVSSLNRFSLKTGDDVIEIRDYQGERLSSINDFRENSIRGPQKVNVSDYKLKIYGLVDNPVEYSYREVLNVLFRLNLYSTLHASFDFKKGLMHGDDKIVDSPLY